MTSTTVMLPFVAVKGAEPLSLELELSRARLEELIGPMIRSTIEPVETALRDAKLDKSRITDVVLVGGSSRMPLVQSLLHDYFGKEARRGVQPRRGHRARRGGAGGARSRARSRPSAAS